MFFESMRKSLFLSLFLVAVGLLALSGGNSVQAQQNAHKVKASRKSGATNTSPLVALRTVVKEIHLPAKCQPGAFPKAGWQVNDTRVQLAAEAQDIDGDTLQYHYTATGGTVQGQGAVAVWDLAGLKPGVYRATVFVNDGVNFEECSWVMVHVLQGECEACGKVNVAGPSDIVQSGRTTTLTANASSPDDMPLNYQWAVSAGRIVSGQGTPNLRVDTTGVGNQNVNATVQVSGLGATCPNRENYVFTVASPPEAAMFDRFVFTNMDDAKARLDTFASQMQQTPDAQAVLVIYGTCANEGRKQAQKQLDYLVQNRGVDASRVQIVEAGCRPSMQVELWVIPNGAKPPAVNPARDGCQPCKGKRRS